MQMMGNATRVFGMIVCLLMVASATLKAQPTMVRLFNATFLANSKDNPDSPFFPDSDDIDFTKRWVTEQKQVTLSCLPGDTARLTTPAFEGGSVIVDNFMTVNDDPSTESLEGNVCGLGTLSPGIVAPTQAQFPDILGPEGNFNCFTQGSSFMFVGDLIHETGFVGVGEIDVPVGSIIPLGTQMSLFSLWDFGILYGNTTLDLTTTCQVGEWPVEVSAEIDICCSGDDDDDDSKDSDDDDGHENCARCGGTATVDFLGLVSHLSNVRINEVRAINSELSVVGQGSGEDCSMVGEDVECSFDLADPFDSSNEGFTDMQVCAVLEDLTKAGGETFEICGTDSVEIRRNHDCPDDDDDDGGDSDDDD